MADIDAEDVREDDDIDDGGPAKPCVANHLCDIISVLSAKSDGGIVHDPIGEMGDAVHRARDRAMVAVLDRIVRLAQSDLIDLATHGDILP